jgi:hypothetical protein
MILFPPSRDKLCDKYYHARFIGVYLVFNGFLLINQFYRIIG